MSRLRQHPFVMIMLSVIALSTLSACSVPDAKSTLGRKPILAEVPEADEVVRGTEDPPIVTLELGTSFREKRMNDGERLPGGIIVPTTNLEAVPVTTALQAVLAGTDVSLSWETGGFDSHLVTVMNLNGPLPKVVDKICNAAKVFCTYRNGMLELAEQDTFVIELPPVLSGSAEQGTAEAAKSTITDAIETLSGAKVQVDSDGGNLIYTTDVMGQQKIRTYLEQLRNGRPLVVMQLYIWEVSLDKNNAAGINWKSIRFPKIGGPLQNLATSADTAIKAVSGGVGIGAVFSGKVDAETVAKFLSTQGAVQTVSNPQLTFISGSAAQFKVGGTRRFVSQVGQLVSSNVSGTSNSSGSIGNNTVSTDSIDTGLEIKVSGQYEGGVIFANMDLSISDLIRVESISTGSTTLQLPETSERNVTTSLRVRAGDNLLLAGLVTSRDTRNQEGIPLFGDLTAPLYGEDQRQNRELVILVKPSVVLFEDTSRDTKKDQPKKQQETPVSSAPAVAPVPDMPPAVLIDKDGKQDIASPASPLKAAAPLDLTPSGPLAETPYLKRETTAAVPIATDEGEAPINKRLLQRGFSKAFDNLLEPEPELARGKGFDSPTETSPLSPDTSSPAKVTP
jgi:Bacterial type II and III secretion system protein